MAEQTTREVDRGFKRVVREIRKAHNAKIKVGYFDKPHESGEVNLATLASIHALGAPSANIPKRDWITPVVVGQRRLNDRTRRRLVGEALDGRRSMESAMFEFGQIIDGKLKINLTRLKRPPLKPQTIAAKRSSNPLIDTGFLRNGSEVRLEIKGVRVR